MEKSKFKFVFPKSSTEYEAYANPTHIEPVTAIVMAEHKTDLCMVYFEDGTLYFICVFDSTNKGNPYKFFYEDKGECFDVYMVFGGSAAGYAEEDDAEEFNARKERMDYDLKHNTFHSQEEVNAYFKGLEDGDGWESYASVSEDFYNKIMD